MNDMTTPIYSTLAADPDLAEIVEMFVDEMPGRTGAITAAWEACDREELGRLAHQLKGAAGSYGFDDVTPYAARLEKAARSDADDAEIQSAHDELMALCSRISVGTPV